MSGENIQLLFSIITSGITLIGVIFIVYKHFRDPDIKADKKISLIDEACVLKHQYLNKDISNIYEEISLIKNNHLAHIEASIKEIKEGQIRLDERVSMILEQIKNSSLK